MIFWNGVGPELLSSSRFSILKISSKLSLLFERLIQRLGSTVVAIINSIVFEARAANFVLLTRRKSLHPEIQVEI